MFFAVLLSVFLSAASAQAAAISSGANATTTAPLNLRAGPGMNYAVQHVLPSGASVYVNNGPFNTSWYHVTYSGLSGYVHGAYLTQSFQHGGGSTAGTGLNQGEQRMVDLINQARRNNGLAAVRVDSRLTDAARKHGRDMATNHFVSHTGSDRSWVGPRVNTAEYQWAYVGENLAVSYVTADAAHNFWMGSPDHRNNILSGNYTEIGVGYIEQAGSRWTRYYVVTFAQPKY
jgi:uncharacterized protein YkwD